MKYKGKQGWTGDDNLPSPEEGCMGPFSNKYICPECGYLAYFCIATREKALKKNPSVGNPSLRNP